MNNTQDKAQTSFSHKTGLTLVECLISLLIVATLVVSVLGAFFISKIGTVHARHRVTAMNIVRQYLEQEIMAGYEGGSGDDYYATVNGPISVSIDTGITGTLTPDPVYPDNIQNAGGGLLCYPPGQTDIHYKIAGFVVDWDEPYGAGTLRLNERATVHVSQHES